MKFLINGNFRLAKILLNSALCILHSALILPDKSKFEKDNKMIKDTITLKFGDWQAVICPRLGGNIIALKYDGATFFAHL